MSNQNKRTVDKIIPIVRMLDLLPPEDRESCMGGIKAYCEGIEPERLAVLVKIATLGLVTDKGTHPALITALDEAIGAIRKAGNKTQPVNLSPPPQWSQDAATRSYDPSTKSANLAGNMRDDPLWPRDANYFAPPWPVRSVDYPAIRGWNRDKAKPPIDWSYWQANVIPFTQEDMEQWPVRSVGQRIFDEGQTKPVAPTDNHHDRTGDAQAAPLPESDPTSTTSASDIGNSASTSGSGDSPL